MSVEGFVRAAGAAMGLAREAFGAGGGHGAATALGWDERLTPATGFGAGSGLAADGFADESGALSGALGALGEMDCAGEQQLREALSAAGVSRQRMDAVIAAAVADVRAMGGSTNTPAGQRALVAAIKRHLEQTQDTLDHAQGDAGTRAAAAQVNAANYAGIGQPTTGAGAALPQLPMPQLPSVPMGGLPLGGVLAPLAGLSSMFSQGGGPQTMRNVGAESPFAGVASCSDQEGSLAAGIPVGEVRVDKIGVAPGREAYRTYIAKALDVMGITDPAARANWARGLEVGAERESGFNPMAINRVDVNAHGALLGDGAPAGCSRGGLQTIPATFASNHQPGTSTNIYDPVANIAAAMNYLMRHYHVQRDGSNLTSVGQFNPHHVPQGY